ncbi:MAG TPA: glycogen debranching N-terminal domain-containing protein, partial [Gemmatimonadaceae bacterium]|nr:glycogen debranching N-terminal domain-containing protein [Gemmatimonadaceae bacterium]
MSVAQVRAEILYAWKGPSLLVTTPRGECGRDVPLSGFYYREARVLSTLRLEINGAAPWLAEAAATAPDRLEFTYVHPEITQPGGGGTGQSGDEEGVDAFGIPERSLDVRAVLSAGAGGLRLEFAVTNWARRRVSFDLRCVLDADFADVQEAIASRREQSSTVNVTASSTAITFDYQNARIPYRSEVTGTGWHPSIQDGLACVQAQVVLESQESKTFAITVVASRGGMALSDEAAREREDALTAWRSRFARVSVPGNTELGRVVARNVRDFGSFPALDGQRDEWLALQAGVPAYPAFFGRDAVTAGWQAAMIDGGEALDAALTRLGRMQSDRFDDWRDEQPGRIPYQVRSGPLALLNLNPYSAYYADFASPLMFVISLANLYAWTGDRRVLERHWDAARRILDWARDYGDADRDGYLEYLTRSSKGTKNQGWKDSGDAIIYDDGSPVPAPIATCELQGYWYVAQQLMGVLCEAMDCRGDSNAHLSSAAELQQRFNRDWWIPDAQFFAVALDPDKRQVGALTSNVGHCLATGIIDEQHRAPVVGRMFAPDLFSGWGVRTLSSSHAFYNPLSYHRGTVWGVEQGTIIFGLRRFGFNARALELTRAMFDLALLYPEDRIPECVGGYARGEHATPGAYPRANTPQLWNATAFPLALQSMLGLVPLAPAETLIVDPVLPTWMPEVVVCDLRVGHAKVSMRFRRDGRGRSTWDVLHKQGTLHVVRQPPPEARSVNVVDRARLMMESIAS